MPRSDTRRSWNGALPAKAWGSALTVMPEQVAAVSVPVAPARVSRTGRSFNHLEQG